MNVDRPLSHFIRSAPQPLLPVAHRHTSPESPPLTEPSRRRTWSSASQFSLRLPLLGYIRSLRAKDNVVAALSEFTGTFLFLLLALGGTNVVTSPSNAGHAATADTGADPAKLLYISLCFGMSLVVTAWVFFRVSGGLFNPAATLGLVVVGALSPLRGAVVAVAQVLGGIAASAVVLGLVPDHDLRVRTSLGPGTTVAQGLFIEMFLTTLLVLTIFMLAAEKHRATFVAPVGIGLSLFVGELMGVYYTGGSLNPARSFGPSVVTGQFHHYHWIYWVGPILGSLLASGFYLLIKALEYETVNPDQDHVGVKGETFDPTRAMSEENLSGRLSGFSLFGLLA